MEKPIQLDASLFESEVAEASQVDITQLENGEETKLNIEQKTPETEVSENQELEKNEFNVDEFIQSQIPKTEENKSKETSAEVEEQPMNAYLWAEKTGRSPQEFFHLNKDWDKEEPDNLLRAYLKEKNPDLDEKEIDYLFQRDFDFASDEFDDDGNIEKSINKKKEIAAAKEYFRNIKSEMGLGVKKEAQPIEIPQEYKEAFDYVKQAETAQKTQEAVFMENRTKYLNELSQHYKEFDGLSVGFETELNGMKKEVSFKFNPSKEDMKSVLEAQSDTSKLFAQFGEMDDKGNFQIKDYDKLFGLIAKASLIDKYEKFIYEQGASDMAESLIKNDLKRPEYQGRIGKRAESNGFSVRVVNPKSNSSTMNLP